MPIGPVEREILRILARNRNPDSFVGDATILHQSPGSPRPSADVDLFHDTAQAVSDAVARDRSTLESAGYNVEITSRQESFCRGIITRGAEATKLEWVQDSAFRFFPVEPDEELGWKLNFWDAATNKVLAFCSRDKLRDWLDVIYLHDEHLHLGSLVWAAAAKDPGLTPELLLEAARRFGRFPLEKGAWEKLNIAAAPDMLAFKRRFLDIVQSAEQLVLRLPPAEMGCLYLNAAGKPVCPEPESAEFASLTRHYGTVKGAWPRIIES